MENKPFISVLLPVYNCEKYIFEAVESILNQTYTHFELLIIDDCSTDATLQICKSFQDDRIVIIEKEKNSGYTNSLNYGISIAKGKYIARMDGDDISLPERFKKQVTFLEANEDVVLCGTWLGIIGSTNVIKLPENHTDIKLGLLKGNCMAHPSVMIKKQILNELYVVYDILKEPAEDYDLWVRLLAIGKLHNLKEVLLNYRVHNMQVSQKREQQQLESSLKSRIQMLEYLNYSFDNDELHLLKKIIASSILVTFNEIKSFLILKEKMILANADSVFDSNGIQKYLSDLEKQSFKNYFVNRESYYPLIYFQYFEIRNKSEFKLKRIDELRLIVKSIIFYNKK